MISYPVPPGAPFTTSKTSKQSKEKKKTKLDRSATFKGKEKEKERERERLAATSSNANSGGDSGETARIPEQQVIDCIKTMKDSLEEMVVSTYDKKLMLLISSTLSECRHCSVHINTRLLRRDTYEVCSVLSIYALYY